MQNLFSNLTHRWSHFYKENILIFLLLLVDKSRPGWMKKSSSSSRHKATITSKTKISQMVGTAKYRWTCTLVMKNNDKKEERSVGVVTSKLNFATFV